jgi:hypothetical protein
MRRILPALAGILLAGSLALGAIQPGSVAYVKVADAPLREGDRLGGPTLATLALGTPVQVLEMDRLRARVRTQAGLVGWITLRQIQEKPPAAGSSGLGAWVREDRSADELGTAASGRGLSEAAIELARTNNISPAVVDSLRRQEDLAASISARDIDAFMREGGLNP